MDECKDPNLESWILVGDKSIYITKSVRKDKILHPISIKKRVTSKVFLNSLSENFGTDKILPVGTRLCLPISDGGSIYVIEQPPSMRNILFNNIDLDRALNEHIQHNVEKDFYMTELSNLGDFSSFTISTPFIIFISVNHSTSSNCLFVFFRSSPLTNMNDILYHSCFPNVFNTGQVCLGNLEDCERSPEKMIDKFWGTVFNNQVGDSSNIYRNNSKLRDIFSWRYYSKLDSNFILNEPFKERNSLKGVLKDHGYYEKNDVIRVKNSILRFKQLIDSKCIRDDKVTPVTCIHLNSMATLPVGSVVKLGSEEYIILNFISKNSSSITHCTGERLDGITKIIELTNDVRNEIYENMIKKDNKFKCTFGNGVEVSTGDLIKIIYPFKKVIRVNSGRIGEFGTEIKIDDSFYLTSSMKAELITKIEDEFPNLQVGCRYFLVRKRPVMSDRTFTAKFCVFKKFKEVPDDSNPICFVFDVEEAKIPFHKTPKVTDKEEREISVNDKMISILRESDIEMSRNLSIFTYSGIVHDPSYFDNYKDDTPPRKDLEKDITRVLELKTLIQKRNPIILTCKNIGYLDVFGDMRDEINNINNIRNHIVSQFILSKDLKEMKIPSFNHEFNLKVGDDVILWNELSAPPIYQVESFSPTTSHKSIRVGLLSNTKMRDIDISVRWNNTRNRFFHGIRKVTKEWNGFSSGMNITPKNNNMFGFDPSKYYKIHCFVTDTGGSPLVLFTNNSTIWADESILNLDNFEITTSTKSKSYDDSNIKNYQPGDVVFCSDHQKSNLSIITSDHNGRLVAKSIDFEMKVFHINNKSSNISHISVPVPRISPKEYKQFGFYAVYPNFFGLLTIIPTQLSKLFVPTDPRSLYVQNPDS